MKQECLTYLNIIGKSKALAATLSDAELEDDEGILNAFTATVNPTEGIFEEVDEEEDLVESNFEKMHEQDDIHIAYAKLYKVSEKHEKLYKLATKKLSDVELDREELSTKFDIANNVASSNTTVFVSPADNVDFENNDVKTALAGENINKSKSILGAPPKHE